MLAFDHGYFQGRLPALSVSICLDCPLFGETDVLMCTRGAAKRVPAATNKPVVLRASGGNSILTELSNECVAVAMEDALRLNVCAVAAQVYIGSEYEHQSINNIIIKLVDAGAVTVSYACGQASAERWRAMRAILAGQPYRRRNGAQFVKTYLSKGFEKSPPAARCRL
jgi:putative autoinducer-2 (AI-2) aldolase